MPWIAGEFEGFTGQYGRRGMMAMLATGHGGKTGDEHVGAKLRMTRTMSPSTSCWSQIRERLAVILGIAKIDRAGEKLPAAVDSAGGQQFLGADDAQFLAEFRAEHVLAAVAALSER